MSKSGIYLTFILAILGAAYVGLFTDWFRSQSIQIIPTIRPDRPSRIARGDETQVYPVAFKFGKPYKLSEVKVVVAAELATNKYAAPLWHMVSDDPSRPAS
jgi:hypothetical protein